MSQILLREINKYNNSIGYFSKNKKLSYSSTDIYIGNSDTKKPLVLNFEECRAATAIYGCVEKTKIIYLNILMQAIETGVPFTIVNTLFTPEEIEDKIKYKLSKTPYHHPIYNIEKEDLENEELNITTKECSMVIHFHQSTKEERSLLRNAFDRSMCSHFGKQKPPEHLRLPYSLIIMSFEETNLIYNPNFVAMGRGLGIYNFFSNNELDESKIANSMVSILLSDESGLTNYKKTIETFQLRQSKHYAPYLMMKDQSNLKHNSVKEYNAILNVNESYITKSRGEVIKLGEIKKFY